MKLYISRVREPSGEWVVDPEPRSKRETERLATLNRVIGGMTTQVWSLEEAIECGFEVNQSETA